MLTSSAALMISLSTFAEICQSLMHAYKLVPGKAFSGLAAPLRPGMRAYLVMSYTSSAPAAPL